MKQFFSLVQKEFYHILRDRRTILILLVMPVILIVLFGFAITTEVNNIRLAIYTPAPDEITAQITEKFRFNRYFTLETMVDSPDKIETLFRENRVDAVLVFENNFSENLTGIGHAAIQVIVDGSEPNSASIMSGYITNVISGYAASVAGEMPPGSTIIPNVKLLYNPQMKSAYNFVPGVMGLILMLICAMMTSISIVREKERGTMEVLLVSPVRPLNIILSKAVPYLAISIVNLITILLLAVYLLDVPVAGSLFWLLVISIIYIFMALALGLLISSLVKSQVAAMLVSGVVLMMPVMTLSGMIFPVENMSVVLQWFSAIIPARWFIAGVKKLMIEGLPVRYAIHEITILSGMAVALIVVSLAKFKNRLE